MKQLVLMSILAVMLLGCDTAKREYGPSALLRKYEWFKDAANTLEKKQADIKVKTEEIKSLLADLPKDRSKWDRIDKEQMRQLRSELSGIKMAYNQLAAEYNSQMAKFNWRFCETETLPPGATGTLPRNFKPYEEK